MGRAITSLPNELRTLCSLGLTLQQAKVYLALAKTGPTSVRLLSKEANIDRGECYRVVSQLSEKRLINEIISSPTRYEVASFDKGVINLFENRKNEIEALEKNTKTLLEEFQDVRKNTKCHLGKDDSTRFVPISSTFIEEGKERLLKIEKSECILSDLYRCETVEREPAYFGKELTWKNGVNIRLLLSDPKGEFDINRLPLTKKFLKRPGFSLRVMSKDIAAPMGIIDEKTAEIYISQDTHISRSSALVTTNERMVRLAQEYFEFLWDRAKEIKSE